MNIKLANALPGQVDERPYWQRVTDWSPKFPHAADDDTNSGGSDDDEEDEEETEDDTDDDDEKEVTIKSGELKKIRASLESANAEAKKRKLELRRIRETSSKETDSKTKEAVTAVEKKYKPVVVKSLAKAAFVQAGFDGEVTSDVLKLIDMDVIEVDEDGDVDGVDEEIARIKKTYPKLFKPERKAPPKVTKGRVTPGNTDEEDDDRAVARKLLSRGN